MAQMQLPLQNEMELAKWISGMFGGKQANPNYSGQPNAPQLLNQMAPEDLQNLMTEFMRGNGNFLQNMMQSKQSGLYNSNTQKLVADDILSQAALKASSANTDISKANAQLTNNYYAQLHNTPQQYLPQSNNKNAVLGGLAIAGLNKVLGKGISDFLGDGAGGKKKKTGISEEGSYDSRNPLGSIFDSAATAFLGGGLNGNLAGESPSSFGTGITGGFDFGNIGGGGGFDLGSIGSSNFDLSGIGDFFSNFSLPSFDIPDLSFDLGKAFDFLDIGSWFS